MTPKGFFNPLKFSSIFDLLNAVLNAVIIIAFPFVVLFLVYAGFLFVFAQGNEEKLARAKKVFFWTVVGALLVLGGKVLTSAIAGTIGQLLR